MKRVVGALAALGLGYLAYRSATAKKAEKGSKQHTTNTSASAADTKSPPPPVDIKSGGSGSGSGGASAAAASGSGSGGSTPLPATNYTGWGQDRAYDLSGKVAFVSTSHVLCIARWFGDGDGVMMCWLSCWLL